MIVGCGSSENAGLHAESHPALKTPCQATDLTLLRIDKLSCGVLPASPRTEDPELWATARPKSRVSRRPDGTEIGRSEYDYSEPFMMPNATYRADGNIATISFPENWPNEDPPVHHFEYSGGTLVGAHAITDRGKEAEVVVRYDGGRRSLVGFVETPASGWHYRYDDDGRLVARIGGGSLDTLPERPEPRLLDEVCNGLMVPTIAATGSAVDAFANMGATYYFRDAAGRITHAVHGDIPATAFQKHNYEWDGDRLTRFTVECSSSAEPTRADQTVTYEYD